MTATIDPRTPALTWTQNRFQGQQVMWAVHSFTTRLPIATASRVHRMKAIASSHVWCAQSDAHILNLLSYYENYMYMYMLNVILVLARSLYCVCELHPRYI